MNEDAMPIIKCIIFYPFFWFVVWFIAGISNVVFNENKDCAAVATVTFFTYILAKAVGSLHGHVKEAIHERKRKK